MASSTPRVALLQFPVWSLAARKRLPSASKTIEAPTASPITRSARTPKTATAATTAGSRASSHSSCIRLRELPSCRWGLEATLSVVVSRSWFIAQPPYFLAIFTSCTSGR